MERALVAAVLVLFLAVACPAQVDDYAWLPRLAGSLAVPTFDLDVVDPSGIVLATLTGFNGASGSQHAATAKHPSGRVFFFHAGAGGALWWFTHTAVGGPIATPGAYGLCIDSLGFVHTLQPGSTGTVLVKRDPFGVQLQSVPIPIGFPQDPLADPFGKVWVSEFFGLPKVAIVDASGSVSGPFTLNASSGVNFLSTIDARGWYWHPGFGPGGTPALIALDDTFTTRATVPLPATPTALGIDRCGDPLVVLPGHTLHSIDLATLTTRFVMALPTPVSTVEYSGVTVASDGRIWVSNGSSVIVVDPDGTLVGTLVAPSFTSFVPVNRGDSLGQELVTVVDRGGDHDLDGVASGFEVMVGADPLDPSVAPPVPTIDNPPVQGGVFTVTTVVPGEAFNLFVLGASGGTAGIALDPADPCRLWPLSNDPLLQFWFSSDNTFARPLISTLDFLDTTSTLIRVPVAPFLSGFELSFAGLTVNPVSFEIVTLTAPATATIP